MNITHDGLDAAMERITTKRDIVSSAKIRAEAVRDSRLFRLRPIIAAAAALSLMCGFTVSAYNMGWLGKIFGESSAIIEENIDKYKVETGSVTIEKGENVPFDFTLGDIITDGESMYIHLAVDNLAEQVAKDAKPLTSEDFSNYFGEWLIAENDDWKYTIGDVEGFHGQASGSNVSCSSWRFIGGGETCLLVRCFGGVHKGDKYSIFLWNFMPENFDKNAVDGMKIRNGVTVNFEIMSEPGNMGEVIEVGKNALLTNHRGDNYTSENFVEKVEITPFKINITGTHERYDGLTYSRVYTSNGNIFINMKDGRRIEIQPDGGGLRHYEGEKYYLYHFFIEKYYDEVILPEDISSIQIGDITVPVDID